MRRALVALAVPALTLALTGCAGSDQATRSDKTPPAGASKSSGATGSSSATEPVRVQIKGDSVTPNGTRMQVSAGRPIRLDVTSDREAELHVHSSPEQELEVKKGESTVTFTVDTPGIVEVEEHESGTVILQLEVR
jgi:hypothetical protein